MFNSLSLSPYTDFVAKALAFVRLLADRGTITATDRVDFLSHLIRQLSRHLAAYDLVTFHHRGANYPDALLLADVLGEFLPLASGAVRTVRRPKRGARLRRRAIRHGLLLQSEYAGHPVPDWPTSPGENLRVLPSPFGRVPEEQIHSPATRNRRLFTETTEPDRERIRVCMRDLDDPSELADSVRRCSWTGRSDSPRPPGEPDQTWLASHLLFSRTVAEHRLSILARRLDWLPDGKAIDRWRERLRTPAVDGFPLTNVGPPPRPGVVSLHDALRVADDWIFLRTTRQTIRDFERQFDLGAAGSAAPPPAEWRLLVPGGTESEPTLCVYDEQLKLRAELTADLSGWLPYARRGGVSGEQDYERSPAARWRRRPVSTFSCGWSAAIGCLLARRWTVSAPARPAGRRTLRPAGRPSATRRWPR